MNIKDFLIDNYMWIIAIILITIITIIGFLADKKKSGKKNETAASPQPIVPVEQTNNQPPMQYTEQVQQPVVNQNNNIGMPQNDMNSMNQMAPMGTEQLNTTMPASQPMMSEQTPPTVMETMNNPQPVENIVPPVVSESMYQPLSEQKPVIAPQPVPNFQNMQMQQEPVQPVTPIPTDNVPNNQTQVPPVMPMQQSTMAQLAEPGQPIVQTQPMPSYSIPNPIPVNNNGMTPNAIPNQGTIPQPVTPIPTPQPIVPQSIIPQPMAIEQPVQPQPTYNTSAPMQTNSVESSPMPQPMMPTPQQPMQTNNQTSTTPQAVNFVFGPQNNN